MGTSPSVRDSIDVLKGLDVPADAHSELRMLRQARRADLPAWPACIALWGWQQVGKWLGRRWEYCPDVEPGSPEAELVAACAHPRTWV